MFQKINYWLKVISLGIILGLGLQFAQAWTNPETSAPNGNVSGPITASAVTQIKEGALGVLGSFSTGGFLLFSSENSTTPCDVLTDGSIRYTGADFEGCTSGVWKSLTAVGGGSSSPASTTNSPCPPKDIYSDMLSDFNKCTFSSISASSWWQSAAGMENFRSAWQGSTQIGNTAHGASSSIELESFAIVPDLKYIWSAYYLCSNGSYVFQSCNKNIQ